MGRTRMTVTFVFALVLLATGCLLIRWRRSAAMLCVASLASLLAVGCGPVPAWLLKNLQAPYASEPVIAWKGRNAIVLLGAGTEKIATDGMSEPGMFAYARITKAATLYNACRKTQVDCKIFVTGGDPQRNGESEASVYGRVLQQLGVMPADLLSESESMNTWQNAQFTSVLLAQYGPDQTVLVSSGFHLRRAALYFLHFGVDATPVRADYLRAVHSVLPVGLNFAAADFAMQEYIGIARYHFYNWMGWNAAGKLPGQP